MSRRARVVRRLPPVLRLRGYALFWVANLLRTLPTQMIAVAVGWQVYAIHQRPFDLGLVGLAEFLPLPLLALPAGQLADRISRRLVFAISIGLSGVVAALLLVVTLGGAQRLWPFLLLAVGSGAASALGNPASRALPPELVRANLLASAMAVRSVASQIGVVGGPAIGGLIFALRPELVYVVAVCLYGVALLCALALHRLGGWIPQPGQAPGLDSLLGGIRFLRRSRVVLGAIVLDLFAVLFGGAVALLPVFARTILHTGPVGLGVLRSAPAVGALVAGVLLTRRPLARNAGPMLLGVVGLFGASIVVFGFSRVLPLSLAALAVSGFADMVSVTIRSTTVALATPDGLRGRVNAVESVFISASNEFGAFESGAAAALVGTVPAVVAGGALTVALALVWPKVFPALSRLDRLEQLRPEPVLTS
ncbi:MAG TPA: MFS transporter [Gaiellaceae bacterium]|nr:MFS transporter [Gaiellaceae bacterium]